MKRILICLVLLAICVGVSIYSTYRVGTVQERIDSDANAALDAIADADEARIKQHIESLSIFWNEEEDRLIHIIRHAQIDDITKSIARLQALASGDDYSELTAELASIRWQMDHINRGERLIFHNLL